MRRCLYDAYAHASSTPRDDDDGDGDDGDDDGRSTSGRRSETSLSTTPSGDAIAIARRRRGKVTVRVFRSSDDWAHARGGMDEDEDEDATTRWSEDGAAFARALSETRSSTSTSTATASVMTRIGEVVWRSTFDGAVPLAGMGLALAKKKKTYDLLRVNLKGTPTVYRERVRLDDDLGDELDDQVVDSVTLGKKLRHADGAEWVERERELVVLGRGKTSVGTVITMWTYDDADDFPNFRCMRVIDCGGDVAPRRSMFRTPRRLRVALRSEDGAFSVAVWSSIGSLSVFCVSKDGEELVKRINTRDDVCAAAWWSFDALAVATRAGNLTVKTVPEDENVLGDKPETFDSIEDLVSVPNVVAENERGRLLLLERPLEGGWRLISINERTPLEMLHSHMDVEEWGVALTLARQHGLDTDEIYKTRWKRSRITIEGLTDWLSRVSDRAWVGVHCLIACADSYEIQRHVLVYGLKESDAQARRTSKNGGLDPEWNWWIKLRLALLGALDRADTVHEITGGGFSSQVYSKLLRSTIAQAALTAAYASDVKSLEIIFKRHACGVRDVIFDSLSALPETSQVARYDKLLPWSEEYVISSGAAQLSGRRTRDWSESEAYLKELNQCEAGDYDLARAADVSPSVSEIFDSLATREWLKSATEELCKLARSPNDSMTIHSNEEMETWTIRRSCEMDAFAGSLSSAHQLLDSASRSLATSTLVDYACAASTLASTAFILFDADDRRICDVSLEEFLASDPYGRLCTILSMLSEKNMSRLMSGPVSEILAHVGGASEDGVVLAREMIQRWILRTSEDRNLELVSRIIRWLSSSVESIELVGGPDALASVVVEASLSHDDGDEKLIAELADMLSDLPSLVAEVPVAKKAISRLNACKLMQQNDVSVSLNDIVSAERDESKAISFVRTFVANVVAKNSSLQWSSLWSDLHGLQSSVFRRSLSHDQVLGELLRAQLRAKDWTHAKRHVPANGPAGAVGALVGGLKELGGGVSAVISPSIAEDIVCSVAEEFLARAEHVDDEASLAAENCLRLMPTRDTTTKRLNFIAALRVLSKYEVRRAPSAINAESALEMVLECAKKDDAGCRAPDFLQEIAANLGVSDDEARMSIILATGVKALDVGDVEAAYATASRLCKRNYGPAWKLCVDVARAMPMDDTKRVAKGSLLAFALVHADQAVLATLLGDWQATQTHQILHAFADAHAGDASDDDVERSLSKACGDSWIGTGVRPGVKTLARHSHFGRALELIFSSSDEKAKEAASAVTYALGVHATNVSDDVLANVAQNSIELALKSCRARDFGSETPPPMMWSAMGVLLTMRDAVKVSSVVDEVASRIHDRATLQTILHFGTCVHALRALRLTWDSINLPKPVTVSSLVDLVGKIQSPGDEIMVDVGFVKQFRSSVGSVVDAEWLSKMIPEIDAGAFAADGADYRKRAIMALAAGSSGALSGAEALDNALRLADVYGVDSSDVYTAHAALLASDNAEEVRRVTSLLKEKLPAHPKKSVETLQTSVWETLPRSGKGALESALAYFEVMSACEDGTAKKLCEISDALKSLSASCVNIDLHAFVDGKGDAPPDAADAMLNAIQRAVVANGQSGFPLETVERIIAAVQKFPSEISNLTVPEDVFFTVARSLLAPPPGATRPSPDHRWDALKSVGLNNLGEKHLVTILNALIGGGVSTTKIQRPPSSVHKELNTFSAEISSRTRLKAVEEVLSVVGDAENLSGVRAARDDLRLVIRVMDDIPGLNSTLLRLLEESLSDRESLQEVAKSWVQNSATFGQLSTLAATLESDSPERRVDVLLAVSSALSDAFINVSDEASELFNIVRQTLGGGSPKDEKLAEARLSAFTKLEGFVAVATPVMRGKILEILSDLASETCTLWPGWRASHQGRGIVNVLRMRTGALLAPFGLESPTEESIQDVPKMCAYFSNELAHGDVKVPFSVLVEVLTLWEEPPKRTRITLKPCWMTLLKRGLRGDERGESIDIVAAQIFSSGASTTKRWLSNEDLTQLLDEAKQSSDYDDLLVAKLSFLLGEPFHGSPTTWDAEAVALAVHAEQIPNTCAASEDVFKTFVDLSFEHVRGRDVLLPHMIAALTRAKMYERAASLALRLTTVHPVFAADFESRLAILREQLYYRAQAKRDGVQTKEVTSAIDRVLVKLETSLPGACASASGALEIALS